MANELNISLLPSQTGLNITAILVASNDQVGSAISLSESSTVLGHYSGSMPAVAEDIYTVRFLSSGNLVGVGTIDWTGSKERLLSDLPTTTSLESRTLPSADYFNPSEDEVIIDPNLATKIDDIYNRVETKPILR